MKEKNLQDLIKLAKTLRQKNQWHSKQTLETWSQYLVEEAQEIQEAITAKDWEEVPEELGDLLWDVVFLLELAEEQNLFSMSDSISSAEQKIKRRNPHIFSGLKVKNQEELREIYQQIKAQEKVEKEKRKQKK